MKIEESKEVKQLKEKIRILKEKNVKIANDFQTVRHDYVGLKRDYKEKPNAYEELVKKKKIERDYTYMIRKYMAAANTELIMRAQEHNAALSAEHQRKNLYEEIKRDKQEAQRRL